MGDASNEVTSVVISPQSEGTILVATTTVDEAVERQLRTAAPGRTRESGHCARFLGHARLPLYRSAQRVRLGGTKRRSSLPSPFSRQKIQLLGTLDDVKPYSNSCLPRPLIF
jgi:hypothetical protein